MNGTTIALSISAINGSSVFCENSAETYAVNITTGSADYYLWTGPTGTTVNSQQIDGYANLLFTTNSGNVAVEVGNSCATATQTLAVSNSVSTFYNGGADEGTGLDASCASTLNGVATGLAISAISGSSVFCDNSAETYAISVTAGAADYYLWTGPTGTTVNSQQIDGYANLLFGTNSGNVDVEVGNSCASVTQTVAVSNSACTFFNGGTDDGAGLDASCASTLNGVATGLAISAISGSSVFCDNSSETYAVSVTAGAADYYLWTGPTGTTVNSQQIDGYANLLFTTNSGNVAVEVGNSCASVTQTIAVSNSACTFFNGGIDDGNGLDASCASTLNGVATGLAISAISGSSVFCDNSSETYAVSVTAGAADYYLWTGPTGTTVSSQQIDGYANLLFTTNSGNVDVEVGNSCASVTQTLAVSNSACTFFNGGTDDGIGLNAACASTLNGVATGLSISAISGSSFFCNNSAETYTVNITTGAADYFLWTGPTGTTVNSQQIDGYANLLFGTSSGNVNVEVGNSCATATETFAVTNDACTYFNGGSNDGFTVSSVCATSLNSGAVGAVSLSAISGSSIFCNNSSETYSVTVTSGEADYYLWTGPTGTSVNSQQIDGYANLLFGNTSGNITVEAGNSCASDTETIAVSNDACTYYFGGVGDGFGVDSSMFFIPLPVTLTYFNAQLKGNRVELSWQTSSEINNDKFIVERSTDNQSFEEVLSIPGAGNSTRMLNYLQYDQKPFTGYSYYRLKQIDFDGQFSYSDIRPIYIKPLDIEFDIYPNPNNGKILNLAFSTDLELSRKSVVIQDVNGLILKRIKLSNCSSSCVISNLSLTPGIYFIKIDTPEGYSWKTKKLIIN